MKRVIFCLVLAALFVWLVGAWAWTHAERLSGLIRLFVFALFAPGYLIASLANRIGIGSAGGGMFLLLFYTINTVFWAAIFYGLTSIYVWRRERH